MSKALRRIVIALACLVCLALVAAVVGRAQFRAMVPLPEPLVLSGSDIGFRVEGRIGDDPAGTLVIRMEGNWVEPQMAPPKRPRSVR